YSRDFNRLTNRDFTRLMIKVYLEMNPEVKAEFLVQYDNFYYEKAGMFLRGFWSVYTMGVAEKQDFTQQNALLLAMTGKYGTRTLTHNLTIEANGSVIPSESVTVLGHITMHLLIEGLIAIILFLFFMIVAFWSIRDAYKVAEAKRNKEKVLKDVDYFKDVYEESFEYIILFPAMFVLGFISIMPIAFGFIIAFTDIKGGESQNDLFNWVGLANFAQIFDFASGLGSSFGSAFWRVLGWTVVWAILSTFTVFFGGFIQALILNSEKVVFRKLWRTILILPWAIPALLSQMVFSVMFNENGFINQFLMDIGVIRILQDLGILGVNFNDLTGIIKYFYLGPGDRIQWFTNVYNKTFVRGSLVILNIWLGFPYFMALMTGVMTAIDQTLYEAADIDGANKFQKITQITMPLVLYSTAPILIMTFSGNFNNFGVIYFITGGGPNANMDSRGYAGDTDILISWMYKLTTEHYIYNMASVFSVLIFFFVGSVTAWNLSRTRAFQED
ncbi:MAG: sugar ABC transporter permease, partial [Bacillota bacterium]